MGGFGYMDKFTGKIGYVMYSENRTQNGINYRRAGVLVVVVFPLCDVGGCVWVWGGWFVVGVLVLGGWVVWLFVCGCVVWLCGLVVGGWLGVVYCLWW